MYVLLQIYPLEAAGDDDFTPLDAIGRPGLGRVLKNRRRRSMSALAPTSGAKADIS
jgi:hypothetical protein